MQVNDCTLAVLREFLFMILGAYFGGTGIADCLSPSKQTNTSGKKPSSALDLSLCTNIEFALHILISSMHHGHRMRTQAAIALFSQFLASTASYVVAQCEQGA